jgi:catechol 2,3-dioxygenase-like lactoylglutathione lyase family enzyme
MISPSDSARAATVPFARLDHVQLAMPAGEEDRARDFFCRVLGMEEIPKPPELAKRGGAWFRSGTVSVHLGVDPKFQPATKAHPAFRCDAYEALLDRLRGQGFTIVPDENPFEGKDHCYIADPFGNRIELIAT